MDISIRADSRAWAEFPGSVGRALYFFHLYQRLRAVLKGERGEFLLREVAENVSIESNCVLQNECRGEEAMSDKEKYVLFAVRKHLIYILTMFRAALLK